MADFWEVYGVLIAIGVLCVLYGLGTAAKDFWQSRRRSAVNSAKASDEAAASLRQKDG